MRLRFDYNSAEDDVNVTMLPAAANTNDDISHQYQYEENNEETPNEDFHQLENELNEVVGHTVQQREETMDQKYLPPIQQQNMSNVRTNAQKKTPHTVLHSPIATSSTGPSGAHIEITNINTDSSSTMELNSNNLAIISTNPTLITSSSTTSPAIPCCVSATTATPIISSVASVGSNPNPNIITTSSPSLSTACTRDQWDSFGELVATEFRNLNSDISRKKLKRKIMQAMLEVGEEDDYL